MSEKRAPHDGVAGASARREYERRRARAAAAPGGARSGLLGFLRGLPRQQRRERTWEVGAVGEELVAASLLRHCPDVPVLHDRRLPGSRANIDHLAFAATGVYVIDAKRRRGRVEVRSPRFGQAELWIGGRNRTGLVDGLRRQVAAVCAVLEQTATDPVPVNGCFCFVAPEGLLADSGVPLVRTLSIEGFPLFHPRLLCRRLHRPGPLGGERMRELSSVLAERFPPA